MSARTPFIPSGSRPVTGAANSKDQSTPETPPATVFTANRLNPLHAAGNDHNIQTETVSKSNPSNHQDLKATPGNLNNGKPLNTAGLAKRRSTQTTSQGLLQNQDSSLQSGNSILRPETADPTKFSHRSHTNHRLNRDYAQTPKILAPVPRQGQRSWSPLLSNPVSGELDLSGFRPPAPVTETASLFSPGPQASRDTHIPTADLGFSFSKPNLNSRWSLPGPGSVNDANKSTLFDDSLKVNTPLTTNSAIASANLPQRVFVDDDDPVLHKRSRNSLKAINNSGDTQTDNLIRSRGKRTRGDLDDPPQQTQQRPKHQRRSMGDPLNKFHTPVAPYNTPSPPPPSSPHEPHDPEYNSPAPRHQNMGPRRQDQIVRSAQGRGVDHSSHAVDRLLGCNSDAYLEDHWHQYEAATAKWKDCSMHEWIIGADAVAARYTKILDFVKAHITAKLDLFANFHNKIDQHSFVLQEREKVLLNAKQRLVKEGTHVLGGGQGC